MSTAREKILDAAEELFGTKGYAATSVREIVDAAGVKAPALYYHFGSKDGLLVALFKLRMDGFYGKLVDELGGIDSLEGFFQAYGRSMFRSVEERPATLRFLFAIFTAPQDAVPSDELLPAQFRKFRMIFQELQRIEPDICMQRQLFCMEMFEGMILSACLQFLGGWARRLPADLADGIAVRAAAMMRDDLPVPAFPDCEMMKGLFARAARDGVDGMFCCPLKKANAAGQ